MDIAHGSGYYRDYPQFGWPEGGLVIHYPGGVGTPVTGAGTARIVFTLSAETAGGGTFRRPKLTAYYLTVHVSLTPLPVDHADTAVDLMTTFVGSQVSGTLSADHDTSAYGCTSPRTVTFDFTGTRLQDIFGITTVTVTEP
jgi:hypothetical protein